MSNIKIKILFLFLLTINTIWGQFILPKPNTLFIVDSIDNKIYTLNQSILDSIPVTVNRSEKYVDTITATGVTLQPNIEQLSSSNRWTTNLGSWTTSGQMSATRQSDSSVTLNTVPTELNPNPYFSNWNYTNLTSGTLTTNSVYKIVIYVSGDNFSNLSATNVTGNIFKASGTTPTTWTNGSTLNLLVAPTGWTASTMGATNYVIQDASGLKLVSDGTNVYITANPICTIGKTYKYKVVISSTSGAGIQLDVNSAVPSAINFTAVGTYEGTFIADDTDIIVKRNGTATETVLSYFSLQEVKDDGEFKLSQATEVNKNYKLSFEAKSSLSSKKVYYSYGNVTDSLSLTSSYQTVNKEFWGQGAGTIKFWASENTSLDLKNISLEEITTKKVVKKGASTKVYFTPNTSSVGNKTASITLNGNKVVNIAYSVEYPDSLLFADSDTTNLGILTANYIDFNFTLHNISPVDTVDMHAWLNLIEPFSITSYPLGWYIMPNDSGIFGMRINHLGVDTLYSVNVGFVGSDVADNFRDTLWHTFVVDMQVNSNTLLKPTNLIASNAVGGINVTWNDPNIADTTTLNDTKFLLASEVNQFTAETGTVITYDVGKMKVAQSTKNYTWNSAYLNISVVQNQRYTFSVDAQIGTSNSVWLVIFDPSIVPLGSQLITNLNSTSNITFEYVYNATYTGTLRVLLQTNTDAGEAGVGQYAYFDNLLIKQTEPSYEKAVVERQSWYLNSPNGNFVWLRDITNGDNSFIDVVSDNTQWNYRVYFQKGTTRSLNSNEDTAKYVETSILEPITADYYVGDETFTGTWANNTLENPMPFSIFYSGYTANLTATNKKVYFLPNTTINFVFELGMVNPTGFTFQNLPSGTTFFSDTSNKSVFTSENELYGWDVAANWEYAGSQPSATGINTWKYIVEDHYTGGDATSIGSIGATYVALDSVIKPYYFASSYTGYASLSTDSSFYKPSFDYPYTLRSWTGTNIATTGINIYTGSSTIKPSEYYNSITVMGACEKLINFKNSPNLTIQGFKFEGGDSYTVLVEDCDNFVFKNNEGSKFNLRFMWLSSCDRVSFQNNLINPGFDEWQGGRIWFEYYWYQGAININNGSINVDISNNIFLNSTSGAFDVYSETTPCSNIRFHDNYVAQSSENLLPYFRPFQIANELGGGTTNPNYVPSEIYIYNNIFKHGNREIKIAGKNIYIFNNIFEDFGMVRNAVFDHGAWHNPPSTQSIFSTEQIYLLEDTYTLQAHKWVFNNTFLNNNESFWQDINNTKLKKNYFHLVNNLFANQSIATADNYKGANDLYAYGSTDYSAYHLDFTIYHYQYQSNTDGIWDVRNNYSYSDYTSSSADKTVIYGGTLSGSYYNPNYYTWAELNIADVGTDNFSGNIADYSSTTISEVLDTSTYEVTSLAKSMGLNLNAIKTIYGANFTDRWGNQITDASGNFVGTMNIGANNKK